MIGFYILVAVVALIGANSEQDFVQTVNDLTFDEYSRLSTNKLLFAGSDTCRRKVTAQTLSERDIVEISEESMKQYFPDVEEGSSNCLLVCLERGQHKDHVLHPLPYQKASMSITDNIRSWIDKNCQAAELGFVSYLDFEADVYWVSEEGQRSAVGRLRPGERNTFWVESYLGHAFQVVNPTNNEVVHNQTVQFNTIVPIGKYYSHVRTREVSSLVKGTFDMEWQRAHRVTRTFTEFGFSKGRLPVDLFASMSAFYHNNQYHATIEEWDNKGVFVNWWERDVYFIAMPFKLKVGS